MYLCAQHCDDMDTLVRDMLKLACEHGGRRCIVALQAICGEERIFEFALGPTRWCAAHVAASVNDAGAVRLLWEQSGAEGRPAGYYARATDARLPVHVAIDAGGA